MENKKYPGDEGVVYFYMGHELNKAEDKQHLTEIIDDVFNSMCEEIRANNYQMLSAATVH